jgi:hypothetical protein
MSRYSRTPDIPTTTRSAHSRAGCRRKILVTFCSFLALTGALAGAVAAMFSIIPATSIKVDPAMRTPAGPLRPARLVGLDHTGGDLRRAPRLTRRARRLGFGMPWTDGIAAVPKHVTYSVLIASA